MQLVATMASFKRVMRRCFSYLLPLVLAVSTLSAISIVKPQSASAANSGLCQQAFTSSGGTGVVDVYLDAGYCYVAFKNNGAVDSQSIFTWTKPSSVSTADVLVIGGGGGGGARHGGGGGAGGFVQTDNYSISSASSISIAVGAGGAGATSSNFRGTTGKTSYLKPTTSSTNGLVALGGGYGANAALATGDADGGSGGGVGWNQVRGVSTSQTQKTFSGTIIDGINFGKNGAVGAQDSNAPSGDDNDYWAGGGGGGASADGETPKSNGTLTTSYSANTSSTADGGKGGDGKTVTWITPTIATQLGIGQTVSTSVYFAGGGGGGMGADGRAGGAGGLGGGAAGTRIETTGNAGTANTGGGGGGSGFRDINRGSGTVNAAPAGAGGSGVVVIRYTVQTIGSTPCTQTVGSNSAIFAYSKTINSVDYCVIEFRNTTSTAWTKPSGVTSIDVLIVGGGGGGGSNAGAGGGGGGSLYGALNVNSASFNLNVVAGAGGNGGAGGGSGNAGTGGGTSSITASSPSINASAAGGAGGNAYTATPSSTTSGGNTFVNTGLSSFNSFNGGDGGKGSQTNTGATIAGAEGNKNSITGDTWKYGAGGGGGGWGAVSAPGGNSFGGMGGVTGSPGSPGGDLGAGGGGGEAGQIAGGKGAVGIVVLRYLLVADCVVPTSANGYTTYLIKNVGSCTWTVPTGVTALQVLLVGGGGGGGAWVGGGGGGGGVIENTSLSGLIAGTSYQLIVGAGGTGTLRNYNETYKGTNGGDTSGFGLTTAKGGGLGASWNAYTTGNGGSGGGGSQFGNTFSKGSGTGGQGFAGGTGFPETTSGSPKPPTSGDLGYPAGGGGGAGGVGGDAVFLSSTTGRTGNGGIGALSAITGIRYGGGGGGGCYDASKCTNGFGGSGGSGGSGNSDKGGGGDGVTGNGTTIATGGSGEANRGGGGGGIGASSLVYSKGGDGGSGYIVVRYANIVDYTYNANDGTGTAPAGGSARGATTFATAANTFTRNGYAFTGWNTVANASGGIALTQNGSNTMPVSATAIVLYAQWADPLLAYEPFTGTAGGNMSGNTGSGSSGLTGNWVVPNALKQDGGAALSGVFTSRSTFSLPTNSGFAVPASNTAASGSAYSLYSSARQLSTPINFATSGTYYLSFISQVPGTGASGPGSALAGLLSGLPTSTSDTGPWSLLFGSTYAHTFAIDYGNANRASWVSGQTRGSVTAGTEYSASSSKSARPASDATHYFNVVKIVTATSGNDNVYLKSYLSTEVLPTSDPSSWDVTYAADISGSATYMAVETEANGTIDEYRVGYTYKSVTDAKPTLSGLALSSGTLSPVFAAGTTSYTASVANSVESITVTPTPTDVGATTAQYLGATGNTLFTGALSVGANIIRTIVTSQDGTSSFTYTVIVTRATSSDATLSALTISSGTLSPSFAPSTTSYTANVSNATTSVTLTPTVNQANATTVQYLGATGTTIFAGPISVGANVIRIVVTAQNGTTSTYTVTVTRLTTCAPTEVRSGGYTYLAFKEADTTCGWIPPVNVSTIDLLVVAGGGGGGATHASGGGAGGLISATGISGVDGSVIAVTVGKGGPGGTGVSSGGSDGSNGFDSTVSGGGITDRLAIGGRKGSSGASTGGSAGPVNGGTANVGGAGATNGSNYWVGGSGGGAGASGTAASTTGTTVAARTAGVGGAGLEITWITTTARTGLGVGVESNSKVFFAGGGGGGSDGGGTEGAGGVGGGGAGSKTGTPVNGFANTGGGGGGSGVKSGGGSYTGGAGGTGVVVIRYALPLLTPTFETATATATGFTIQIANFDAGYTWSGTATAGTVSISAGGLVTVSGVSAGTSSTATITNTTTAYAGASAPVSATSLVATYTITLAAGTNGVGSNRTLTKTDGTGLTLPDSATANSYFTRAGYTVTGWSASSGGVQAYALGGSYTTESATTLYPVWTAISSKLRLSYNSSDINSYDATVGTTVTDLSGSSVNGTVGTGITLDSTGSWVFAGTGTTPYIDVADVTSTQFANNGITVDFEADFGSIDSNEGVLDFRVGSGGANSDFIIYRDRTSSQLRIDIYHGSTYKGSCVADVITSGLSRYTITLDGTNCDVYRDSNPVVSQSFAFKPQSGDTWTNNRIGSLVFPNNNYVGSLRSIRIYEGVFTPTQLGAIATNKTITYSANSGTSSLGSFTTSGSVRLPSATRAGYAFSGWYTLSTGGSKIGDAAATYAPTQDVTLHAQWTVNSLTVTYDPQGGTAVSSGAVNTGATLSAPTAPTRVAYTFSGWSASPSGSTVTFPYTHGQTSSFTLYAIWSANLCSAPTADTTSSPGYTILKFTNSSPCVWSNNTGKTDFDIALVGGGGAGGFQSQGAGGGAGQVIVSNTGLTIDANKQVAIEIGAGGAYRSDAGPGSDGQKSSIYIDSTLIVAAQGGGGGAGGSTTTGSAGSGSGGSGGGGRGNTNPGASGGSTVNTIEGATPSNWTGYANAGGDGDSSKGGGGGGAGSSGFSGTSGTPGLGGTGYSVWGSTNSTLKVAGGGAGYGASAGGTAVSFGGGNASTSSVAGVCSPTTPCAGTANKGGGGGTNSAGGSGVVFIRYSNTYTITYNISTATSGAASASSSTYTSNANGATLATVGTLEKTGYVFGGWSTSNGGAAVSNYKPTSNVTLHIVWTPNSLVVSYDEQGGSTIADGAVNVGASISAAPTAPTKDGYSLSGWSTTSTGSVVTFPYAHGQTSGFTLYAIWTVNSLTITYNSKGGTAVTSGLVNTGANILVAPTAPTKTGYTFAGWSATDGGSVITFPYTHGQTAGFTLFAIWNADSLTVTYNSKGGTAVTGGAVNTGASISAAPTAPTKDGYIFAGWSATDGGSAITFPYLHGQTVGFSLYALWTPDSLTVTYNSKGGSAVTAGSVNTGASISTAPTVPTKAGYSLAGWSASDGGSVVTFPYAHGQTAGFTMYAIWTPNSLTITYNSQGGTAVSPGAVNTAANVPAAPTAPTKAGYTFAGWSATDGGSAITFPYIHGQTDGFTLFARWTGDALAITYNSKGGSAVSNGSTVTEGSISVAPTAPTKANYTFAGWSATDGGSAVAFPFTHGKTAAFTMYALWTANAYVLTYVYNSATSGNTTLTDNFTTGGTTITLPTPLRTGYDFSGWYADALFATSIGAAGAPFGPTGSSLTPTAYAKWTGINRTVTYSAVTANGGAVPVDATSYIIGGTVVIKANSGSLVRTGYEFVGWTYASDGTGAILTSGTTYTTATSNMVFYAKWSANTYTVTYNKNGASGSPTAATATYTTGGDPVSLTTVGTMVKTGFNFGGWSASPTGAALSGTYTTAVDITLYAVWNIKSINITFSKGDALLSTFFNFPINRSSNYGTTITLSDTVDSLVSINGVDHAFMGWNDGTSVYKSGATYLLGETAPTFIATWVKIFAVRYAFNGGTAAVGSSAVDGECLASGATCTDGQVITANAAPSRDGYSFDGWVDQFGVAVPAGQTFTVRDNRYLIYANWTPLNYSISYNTVGGSPAAASFTKQMGQTFVIADAPAKTGYSFDGWSNGATIFGAGVTYFVATSAVTLTAQWTPDVYTVVYDWNGGSGSTTSNGLYTVGTNAISLPVVGDHIKDGYTFAGWSTSNNGTLISGGYTPTANTTLYAIWGTGSYTITYNGNLGTVPIASAAILNGSSLILPTPTRDNFVFDGWFTDLTAGTLIGAATDSFLPTQSRTLYAHWTQRSLAGLSPSVLSRVGILTASDTGATTTTHENANSSVTVAIPAATLPPGTTINIDRVGDLSRAQNAITGNNSYLISVVVSWITPAGTVPNTNTGKAISVTITNASIKAGAKVYGIVAGSVAPLGTATQNGTVTVQLTSDPEVVVFATKPEAPTSLAVTSTGGQADLSWAAPSTDGGSEIIGYTVTGTGGVTCTTTTTSCSIAGLSGGTAYTFTVTAANALGNSDASSSASATTGTIYLVTFDPKGGSTVVNGSFFAASTVTAPTIPTRSGYTFAGWSATDGGAVEVFPYAPGVTNNITMYARWTAINHAVTFNSNSGSAVPGTVFATGGTVSEPSAPSRSGYTFAGWSATNGGSALVFPYSPGVVTGFTLYALWTQNAPVVVTPTPSNPVNTSPANNVIVTAPVTVVGNKDAKVSNIEVIVPITESNANFVSVKVDKANEKFIEDVKIVDSKLVLTPKIGFSGRKTVMVTITEYGVDRVIQVPLTVLPEAVSKPVLTPASSNKTTVRWTASPNATSYSVYLNGKRVCPTASTSCSVPKVLGPDSKVEVIANGADRTFSEKIKVEFKQTAPVLITKIFSETLAKAKFTSLDLRKIDSVIAIAKSQGFKTIVVSDITKTKKTEALAAARIAAIKKYIAEKTDPKKIAVEVVPVASRTYFNNISLKG